MKLKKLINQSKKSKSNRKRSNLKRSNRKRSNKKRSNLKRSNLKRSNRKRSNQPPINYFKIKNKYLNSQDNLIINKKYKLYNSTPPQVNWPKSIRKSYRIN